MNKVVLDWGDGAPVAVPALWLRENCPCDECRVASTTERRVMVHTHPIDLAPLAVEVHESEIEVVWPDHRTIVSRAWLEELDTHRARSTHDARPWEGGDGPPRFDHDEVVALPIDLIDALERHGAAIVTGTPTEPGSCESFIRRWVPLREVAFGRIHDVFADPAGYNIAHTAEALPPHNDMASYHAPPSGQIIHMLVNDAAGGDSTLIDGWAAVARLEPEDREVLASVWVPFRQFGAEVETWARAPLIRFDDRGSVVHLRYSNQLMQSLEPDHVRVDDFCRAYHRLSTVLSDPAMAARFRLDAGDLLLMHNHRVLHGRTAYEPGSGARHLQDVYFELEDLINHRRVLEGLNRT